MTKANNPRTYRELAHKFRIAALRSDTAAGRKFNNEQADAWSLYADRLEERLHYLTVTSAHIPRLA